MMTNQVVSKIKWFVPTFVAVIAFVWELEGQLGLEQNGLEWLVKNIGIALLLVLGIYFFSLFRTDLRGRIPFSQSGIVSCLISLLYAYC